MGTKVAAEPARTSSRGPVPRVAPVAIVPSHDVGDAERQAERLADGLWDDVGAAPPSAGPGPPPASETAARGGGADRSALAAGGQPLPPSARAFFEPRLAHDFSQVRIHADERAAELARAAGASAFTSGKNIVFAAGTYLPDSGAGRRLLAHELVHTTQPGNGQTVRRAAAGFDADQIADHLRQAMAGWGTDEERIYAALSGRTRDEVNQIDAAYQRRLGRSLTADLQDELTSDELLRLGALGPAPAGPEDPTRRAMGVAMQLRDAMQGWGTDETAIAAALTARSPAEQTAIKDAYRQLVGRELMADLFDELSGADLDRALLGLGIPPETPESLARRAREAFRGLGTDEDAVFRVLDNAPALVRAMINYYNDHLNDETGRGFVEDLRDELSGDDLARAMTLLAPADLAGHTTEVEHPVPSAVAGDPNRVWVGLIVRGKWSPDHHPSVFDQHADVVFPDAAGRMTTRGYFGEQGGSGQSGSGSSGSQGAESIGLGMNAVSADMSWFLAHRPFYVDLELARIVGMHSSLILIKVTRAEAATFNTYWQDLANDPGSFFLLGHNCSTAAAAGFEQAAVGRSIDGLDTPDSLFDQLRQRYHDAYMISGFYGYRRAGRQWSADGRTLIDPGTGPWTGPYVIEQRLS